MSVLWAVETIYWPRRASALRSLFALVAYRQANAMIVRGCPSPEWVLELFLSGHLEKACLANVIYLRRAWASSYGLLAWARRRARLTALLRDACA